MLTTPPHLALSTLSVSPSSPPKKVIEWASGAGFRGILLDSARAGIRPRDLDRSARRGLASALRRLELTLAGLELWIPPQHYASAQHAERALAAVLSSIDLLAELAALVETDRTLTLNLPQQDADDAIATIIETAHRAEITIASATWPPRESTDDAPIGVALDPRAILRNGDDPISIAAASITPPAAARWSYASRRPEEVLDPLGYASSLAVAGFKGAVALDLRDAVDPETDAQAALDAWAQADPFHS